MQSLLGSRDEAATIWHANEAAETEDSDVQLAAADEDTSEPAAAGVLTHDSKDRFSQLQLETTNEAKRSDWQQVADAAHHEDTASRTAGSHGSIDADMAGMQSGSSRTTFEDGQRDGEQADGGPASEPATAWQGQAREGGMHNTMTEPLAALTDSSVLAEAEEVAESARQYNPTAAVLGRDQQTKADASEAALPLQARPVVSAVRHQEIQSNQHPQGRPELLQSACCCNPGAYRRGADARAQPHV